MRYAVAHGMAERGPPADMLKPAKKTNHARLSEKELPLLRKIDTIILFHGKYIESGSFIATEQILVGTNYQHYKKFDPPPLTDNQKNYHCNFEQHTTRDQSQDQTADNNVYYQKHVEQ